MSSLHRHRLVTCVPVLSTMVFALVLSPRAAEAGYAQWIDEWRQTDLVVVGELSTGTFHSTDEGFSATANVPRDPSLLPELPGFAIAEPRSYFVRYERSFQVFDSETEILFAANSGVHGFRLPIVFQSTGGYAIVDFANVRAGASYDGQAYTHGGSETWHVHWLQLDSGIYDVSIEINIASYDNGTFYHDSPERLPTSSAFVHVITQGIAPVPEPSALAGMLIGLGTIGGWSRLRACRRRGGADAA